MDLAKNPCGINTNPQDATHSLGLRGNFPSFFFWSLVGAGATLTGSLASPLHANSSFKMATRVILLFFFKTGFLRVTAYHGTCSVDWQIFLSPLHCATSRACHHCWQENICWSSDCSIRPKNAELTPPLHNTGTALPFLCHLRLLHIPRLISNGECSNITPGKSGAQRPLEPWPCLLRQWKLRQSMHHFSHG